MSDTIPKPLTLSIIPQQALPLQLVVSQFQNFEYTPTPIITLPPQQPLSPMPPRRPKPIFPLPSDDLPPEELSRIERRLEKERERARIKQRRYNQKIRPYNAIALLPNIHEKLKRVWLISYPELADTVDNETLEGLIDQSTKQLLSYINHN